MHVDLRQSGQLDLNRAEIRSFPEPGHEVAVEIENPISQFKAAVIPYSSQLMTLLRLGQHAKDVVSVSLLIAVPFGGKHARLNEGARTSGLTGCRIRWNLNHTTKKACG